MSGLAFPALYGAESVRAEGDFHQNVFEQWAGLHDGGYLPDHARRGPGPERWTRPSRVGSGTGGQWTSE